MTKKKNEVKFITNEFTRIKSPIFETLNEDCFGLLAKIFQQKNAKWVEVNTITKSALIHHNGSKGKNVLPVSISRAFFWKNSLKKIKFHRSGNIITNWEIVHDLPERIRLHHPLMMRKSAVCSSIEKAISNTVGIVKCKISSLTGNILITYQEHQINKEQIILILENALSNLSPDDNKEDEQKIGNFELSTASFGFTLAFPELLLLTVPAVLFTGFPIFKKAFQALREKKVKVDILDTVVIAGCLAANQVSVAAFMVWVVALADKIQSSTSKSTGKMLNQIFGSQPRFAWLKKGDLEEQVAITNLKKDDVIVVHSGEAIPIDGMVFEGEALVDQSAMTGESQSAEKRTDDKVFSCTTVVSGQILIKVETTGQETLAGKIQQIITEASSHRTHAQSIGEKIADKAVIPTLGLGAIGMAIGGPNTALAVINADFGTGIRVAAPTLLLAHLITLAQQGILVKKGEVLEKLSKADVFIFDKTGTLTAEMPEITEIISLKKKYSKKEILRYAATAEQWSSHPIGKAIIDKAKENNLNLPPKEESKCHIGLGVEVKINEKNIKVGSLRYMEGEKVVVSKQVKKKLNEIKKQGQGVVLISVNNDLAGLIKLKTTPRKDAYKIIQYLKSKGIKETVLISGDNEGVTRAIAAELGIDKYFAEVLPHEKADYVKKYKEQGKIVAMVGDGVNDGPALSVADISISLKGASDIAIDTASIIFFDGHFEKIHLLFDSAHRFNKGVWSSFRLIAVPNAICIVGALVQFWGLGMSLVLNNCFNIIATIKSFSPLFALESTSASNPPSLPKENVN